MTWRPLEQGRTALNQLQECAITSGFTVYTLTNLALPPNFSEEYSRELAALDTVEKAIARLEENAARLFAAIEAFPDANLDKTVMFPWKDEPSSMAEVMFMTYWNLVYHIGQVCYIQTLYGDSKMH